MRQDVVPAPPVDELLPDAASRARFEEVSAALEAADLVRRMRRRALSVQGTAGISQEELARRTGLSQPRISQIESSAGRDGLSYAVLRRIAHACGIDWGQMLRDGLDRSAEAGVHLEELAVAVPQTTYLPTPPIEPAPDVEVVEWEPTAEAQAAPVPDDQAWWPVDDGNGPAVYPARENLA
jgi:transcriptional regulator with XRE-family HTH domain